MRAIDADQLKYEADTCIETTEGFKELIDKMPTIPPQRPNGRFEKIIGAGGFPVWRCTNCKIVHYLEPPTDVYYCPRCGANMDLEVEQ